MKEKLSKSNEVFTNFLQLESFKNLFFNVDVCEEVTERILKDKKFAHCEKEYPNAYIGKKANISVSVENGLPYILRSAGGPDKAEYEISGSSYIAPLFTQEELKILKQLAGKVRMKNKKEFKENPNNWILFNW